MPKVRLINLMEIEWRVEGGINRTKLFLVLAFNRRYEKIGKVVMTFGET